MKCPHCSEEITDDIIAHYLASKGGKKSRRKLTPEQAKAMVEARELKKKGVGHGLHEALASKQG